MAGAELKRNKKNLFEQKLDNFKVANLAELLESNMSCTADGLAIERLRLPIGESAVSLNFFSLPNCPYFLFGPLANLRRCETGRQAV